MIQLHVITTIVGIFIVMESARAFNQFPRFDQQYHIQTDQGANRFFRYQTLNGIYRKEQRHPDGSVVGTYGWVDPHNIFRLYDYVSDEGGYRIERKQLLRVTGGEIDDLGFQVYYLDPNGISPSAATVEVNGLVSTFSEANPNSKQEQATFFNGLVPASPRRIVIGKTASEEIQKPLDNSRVIIGSSSSQSRQVNIRERRPITDSRSSRGRIVIGHT